MVDQKEDAQLLTVAVLTNETGEKSAGYLGVFPLLSVSHLNMRCIYIDIVFSHLTAAECNKGFILHWKTMV